MKSNIFRGIFISAIVTFFAVSSTGSYFSDTAVVKGNSFSTGEWTASTTTVPTPRMVINEVFYDGTKEWIEFYNAGNGTADIKGWSICDSAECGGLNPSSKTEIKPGEFVIVAHSSNDLFDWNLPTGTKTINYSGGKIVFNDNPGDRVVLRNELDITIDAMSYGNDKSVFDPACSLVADGHSLERNPKGTDTDSAVDFVDRAVPTPGV